MSSLKVLVNFNCNHCNNRLGQGAKSHVIFSLLGRFYSFLETFSKKVNKIFPIFNYFLKFIELLKVGETKYMSCNAILFNIFLGTKLQNKINRYQSNLWVFYPHFI